MFLALLTRKTAGSHLGAYAINVAYREQHHCISNYEMNKVLSRENLHMLTRPYPPVLSFYRFQSIL